MDIPETGAIFTLGKSHLAENSQSYFFIKNDPIKTLVSGTNQSAVVCESGRLFVWGENEFGQLGITGNNSNEGNVNNNSSDSTTKTPNKRNGHKISQEIITKPTCVKFLKQKGLKVRDISFGGGWSIILTETNDLFFCGRNIFLKTTKITGNFSENRKISEEVFSITKNPIRLEEFDGLIQQQQNTNNDINKEGKEESQEIFEILSAGNDHFVVLTSKGRLFGWGSNENYQLGVSTKELPLPVEVKIDSPIKQFTCGPNSTLILTVKNQLFLTGSVLMNEYNYSRFTELTLNFPAEPITFLHLSETNSEIFIITESGCIYKSTESLRNKNLTFQKFYDYDNDDKGPALKLLKGLSFFAVLTKKNKFFTTFSESGHHLKTFREISKYKNLKILDLAVGDQHVLILGIQKTSAARLSTAPSNINVPKSSKNVVNGNRPFDKTYTVNSDFINSNLKSSHSVNGLRKETLMEEEEIGTNSNENATEESKEETTKGKSDNTSKNENKGDFSKLNGNNGILEDPKETNKDNSRNDVKKDSKLVSENGIGTNVNSSAEIQDKNSSVNRKTPKKTEQMVAAVEKRTENERSPLIKNPFEVAKDKSPTKSIELKKTDEILATSKENKEEEDKNSLLKSNEGEIDSLNSFPDSLEGTSYTLDGNLSDTIKSNSEKLPSAESSSKQNKKFIKTTPDDLSNSPLKIEEGQENNGQSGRSSSRSIKFDQKSLKSQKSQDKLNRPQTPFPNEPPLQTTPATVKKVPNIQENETHSADSNKVNNITESIPETITSTDAQQSTDSTSVRRPSLKYSDRQEKLDEISKKIILGKTPLIKEPYIEFEDGFAEKDDELIVEVTKTDRINNGNSDDPLNRTTIINEIRFINNGVDVTETIQEEEILIEESDTKDDNNEIPTKEEQTKKDENEDEELLNDSKNNLKPNNEEDERTTASVNSNKSMNPPDTAEEKVVNEINSQINNFTEDIVHSKGIKQIEENIEENVTAEKGKVKRFINDLKSKGKDISCRSNRSVQVEDEPASDPKVSAVISGDNSESKTSKVCVIL